MQQNSDTVINNSQKLEKNNKKRKTHKRFQKKKNDPRHKTILKSSLKTT